MTKKRGTNSTVVVYKELIIEGRQWRCPNCGCKTVLETGTPGKYECSSCGKEATSDGTKS